VSGRIISPYVALSYAVRNAWTGSEDDGSANEDLSFTSFRYCLP
jgi:hypothetical protein